MSGSLSDYRPTIAEANTAYDMVVGLIKKHATNWVRVGSFGRHYGLLKDRVGDVDIVVCAPPKNIECIRKLLSHIWGTQKNGKGKTSGVIGLIQVDVLLCEPEVFWPTYLFYFLPKSLQIACRACAAARGYSFGPRGIRVRNSELLIPCDSLDDTYKTIGVEKFTSAELIRAENYTMEAF